MFMNALAVRLMTYSTQFMKILMSNVIIVEGA